MSASAARAKSATRPPPGVSTVLAALAVALWMGVLPARALWAQPAGSSVGAAGPQATADAETRTSVDELRARLESLEAQAIPADEKARRSELLGQAIVAAERADGHGVESQRLTAEIRGAAARKAEIEQTLSRPAPELDVDALVASTSVADSEAKLRETEAEFAAARQRVQALSDELGQQRQRPEALQASLTEARDRLASITEEMKAAPVPGEPPGVTEDRQLVLEARQRMRRSEVALLEQQLGFHDERLSLLAGELELAQRQVDVLEGQLSAWQAVAQRQRETEAQLQAREAAAAEQAVAAMPVEVRDLAERNTALAEELRELAERESEVVAQLTRAETRLNEVAEDFTAVRERVELAGLNDTIALVLRKQRDALPTMGDYRSLSRKIRTETGRASGRQLDHEATLRDIAEPAKAAARFIDALEPPVADAAKPEVLERVREALARQRQLSASLREDYVRYIKQLGRLDNAQRSLVSKADEFNRLIDEHLLWIRSAPPVSAKTLARAVPALAWLAAPSSWTNVVRDVWQSLPQSPVTWLAGLTAIALVFVARSRARLVLTTTAANVGQVSTDAFSLTVRALLATLLLAAAWPLVAALLGWLLRYSATSEPFSRAVGGGLLAVALIGFGFRFLRRLARDGALGDAHFGWPQQARRELGRHLSWLAAVVVPLGFIIWTVESYDDEGFRASLGRIAFVVAMLALTVFIVRILRPNGALFSALSERHPRGLIPRLRYVWLVAAAATPLLLAVLSVFGYHYSAVQLQNRLQATAWIVIALVVVNESLMRWLYVTHRRLAHMHALEEENKARKEREEVAAAHESEDEFSEVEEPKIDLDAIQAQTGSLIRTVMGIVAIVGLWITWASVLPALSILDEVTLWRYPQTIEGVEQLVPVTLVDTALALLFAVVAYLGTKNLPGALELAVLNRTSLDAGAKYAFTTLCRYLIAGAGILIVFNYLGMEWSRLQWLVAALGVGLGFGLQEIVANFISGLILLFERPIRVGDIVTINGASGTVTRIRIRATTVTDWDRKELIVPNKRFITGEVLNWTLSNELNRIVISVGIAYGADTHRARELMLEIARSHPRILQDPAPIASFEGFGDNALNLVLRCYMPTLDGRLGVITELHSEIDRAFSEAGIEIAFPQRDVHIDTRQPLAVRVLEAGARSNTGGKDTGHAAEASGDG